MHQNDNLIDEDEIDIKEVFRTIHRYKYMIILLVILFGLGSAYYAYFKTNIYKASATVEVGIQARGFGSQDMLAMATMGTGTDDTSKEIQIIQSRFLAEKAADKVNVTHRYYTTRRFKEVELYKASPFEVGMLRGYGYSFILESVDDNRYRLILEEQQDENGLIWSYNALHWYGKEVSTKHFHLNVIKKEVLEDESYRFVVYDPQDRGIIAQGGVSVTQVEKYSSVLMISYEDNIPSRAKEFANALSTAYIEQNIERKTKEAEQRLTFIDKQLKEITENLKGSAIKLEEFKKTSNMVNLSSKAETIIRQMSEYESKLAEITLQKELLNKLYDNVKSGKNIESIALIGIDNEASALADMIKKLQDAILKKKVLREDYTEMYPEVRKLKKTIIQLKKVIVSTIKNLSQSMKEQQLLLEKSVLKMQKQLNKLPADERMFGQLQRKFVVNEKIYSYLLEKRSETAIVKASTVSKNRVLDTALLPYGPIKPKRKLIVLVGLILGLILGIALAFLREFLDDRIKSEDDIHKGTSVPVLGTIPNIDDDSEKVKVFLAPKSAVAESFRNLRTNLQFMRNERNSHVIAVTSTVGGEGKTTTCINLGGIMSMADKKTVILNLDMRKPTLHEKFGLTNTAGMSTLLSERTALNEVIQHTDYANLDIITSGPVPPNPSELIQGVLMEKILEKLREVYDIIILDTPPVGLVTDARTLMHFADTSLYVLRSDHSQKSFLRNIEKLSKDNISGFGIIFNDIKAGSDGYGYGYGYYEEDGK